MRRLDDHPGLLFRQGHCCGALVGMNPGRASVVSVPPCRPGHLRHRRQWTASYVSQDTACPSSGFLGETPIVREIHSADTGAGNDLLIHPGPVRAEVRIWVLVVPAVQNGCEGRGLCAACGQVSL